MTGSRLTYWSKKVSYHTLVEQKRFRKWSRVVSWTATRKIHTKFSDRIRNSIHFLFSLIAFDPSRERASQVRHNSKSTRSLFESSQITKFSISYHFLFFFQRHSFNIIHLFVYEWLIVTFWSDVSFVRYCSELLFNRYCKDQISNIDSNEIWQVKLKLLFQKRMTQRIYQHTECDMDARDFCKLYTYNFSWEKRSQKRSLEIKRCYRYFLTFILKYIFNYLCSLLATHRLVRKSYFILKYLNTRTMIYSNNKIK